MIMNDTVREDSVVVLSTGWFDSFKTRQWQWISAPIHRAEVCILISSQSLLICSVASLSAACLLHQTANQKYMGLKIHPCIIPHITESETSHPPSSPYCTTPAANTPVVVCLTHTTLSHVSVQLSRCKTADSIQSAERRNTTQPCTAELSWVSAARTTQTAVVLLGLEVKWKWTDVNETTWLYQISRLRENKKKRCLPSFSWCLCRHMYYVVLCWKSSVLYIL